MFIFLLILFVCILLLPSCARADEAPAAHQRRSLQSLHDAFSSAANSQYAYSIAHRLATDLHLHNNATYGGRQAGRDGLSRGRNAPNRAVRRRKSGGEVR